MNSLDTARGALHVAGYDAHEISPGPGLYITGWEEPSDEDLEAVRDIVEPCGCTAEWDDDDIVIEAADLADYIGDDGECLECGHPANGSSGHGLCDSPAHRLCGRS